MMTASVVAISAPHSDVLWQILTALAVILTVVSTHLRAGTDRKQKQAETVKQMQDVQDTVNGTTHQLTARVDQLSEALTSAGINVPPAPGQTLTAASERELQSELASRQPQTAP